MTPAELEALRGLSPATQPPAPADISNRFADKPAAAVLGPRLFFEAGFSGKLLDGDNDGSPNALGRVGETGKVGCASQRRSGNGGIGLCH